MTIQDKNLLVSTPPDTTPPFIAMHNNRNDSNNRFGQAFNPLPSDNPSSTLSNKYRQNNNED